MKLYTITQFKNVLAILALTSLTLNAVQSGRVEENGR